MNLRTLLFTSLLGFGHFAPAEIVYWDINGGAAGAGSPTPTGAWGGLDANWSASPEGIAVTNAWVAGDTAAFAAGLDATGRYAITVSGTQLVGGLIFEDGTTQLTGGTLDWSGSNVLIALLGAYGRIDSVVSGTGGLVKTGSGTVLLTNPANGFSGPTVVNNGTLVITSAGALGIDGSPVAVNGGVTVGVGGGNLTLAGDWRSGINITRDLVINGGGPQANGPALTSIGDNVISGGLQISPGGLVDTRIASAMGTLTISGTVTLSQTTARNLITQGVGNILVDGQVTGIGNIIKTGGGGMTLTNTTNDFTGTVRVDAGSLRIDTSAVLGPNSTTSAISFNGGILEIRTDAPDFQNKNLSLAGSTGSVLVLDRDINGVGLNQTIDFGDFTLGGSNRNLTVNGRNGYGLIFTGAGGTIGGGGAEQTTFTVNTNGLVTLDANFWNNNDSTARTLTIGGTGNTLITGSILASNGAHVLSKTGAGTLTILGTASTYTGVTGISGGGTLAISGFGSLGANAGSSTTAINMNSGTLNYLGAQGTGAGETTTRVINLSGTTGGATLLANQTGSAPTALILTSNFTASGAGSKTLVLGGANTLDNEIRGAVINNSGSNTTALTKTGSGTWMLSGTNLYTGATTIGNGILKIKANAAASTVIHDNSAITFNAVGTGAAGTLEFVGQAGATNIENLGTLSPLAGAATIKLTPGAGGTASLVFASWGGAASGAGYGVNIMGSDASNTVTLTGVPTGFVSGSLYFGGANFAYSNGGVLRAANYGVDAGFVTSNSALTATAHNEITGSVNTNTITINSLKIDGAHTLTLNGSQTLTVNAGATSAGGGILANGGASIITGGTGITTGGAGALVVRVNGAGELRIESNLTAATTGGLTKNGVGTLVLAGNNLQTGATNLNEGKIQLAVGGRLSGASAAFNMRQETEFDLSGVSTGTAIGAFNGMGTVTNSSGTAAVLTLGNGNGTGTFAGVIEDGAGRISVTKVGTGAQTWSGLNIYTGATTIGSTGIVTVSFLGNIGDASGIGAGDDTSDATNAASLVFNGTSGAISYAGNESIRIDRLFTLAGTGARIQANGVNNASMALIKTNSLTFAVGNTDAQLLTLSGASIGDNQIDLRLIDNSNLGGGPTSLTKAEAGLWILGNSLNSYTGTTTISGGALRAQDGGSLPTASNLLIDGGVLESFGTFDRSLGVGIDQVQWRSGGFAASTDRLTVNIGAQVVPDTLVWGSSSFFPSSSTMILNSTTALFDVDVINHIDLGSATRTIQVNDNTSTAFDFATLSGNLSGTGANLTKTGNGRLQLLGANTYTGNTAINAGSLVVTSVGGTGVASTSLGAAGGILSIGSGTTSGTLIYVGAGETSDRLINLSGTNNSAGSTTSPGTPVIEANGSGALKLSNVVNSGSYLSSLTKTLTLRGANTDANEISSVLANNGGNLAVSKSEGGVWVLSGNNTYLGTTTVSAGALGIGSSTAFGAGNLTISNGSIFAFGADRTLANTIPVFTISGNTTAGVIGDHSISLNATATLIGSSSGSSVLTNNLSAGNTFTLSGGILRNNDSGAGRTLTINGSGATIINSQVIDNPSATVRATAITYSGNGTLTLTGDNTYTGTTTVNNTNGRLMLDGAGKVSPNALTVNAGTLQILSSGVNQSVSMLTLGGGAAGSSAQVEIGVGRTLAVTGVTYSATNNNLTGTISGGTLDLGGASRTFTVGNSTSADPDLNISSVIANNGGLGAIKTGTGTLKLSGTTANTIGGTFTVNSGTLVLAKSANVNAIGTSNLEVNSTSGFTTSILEANEQIADTATVTVTSTSTSIYSTFQLNGYTETIAGLTLNTVTGAGAGVITGLNGRLIVNGDIFLNNNRNASGNSARDILITGTGSDGTAAPNTGYLDLGGAVRTITVASVAPDTIPDADATIETIIENGGIVKAGTRRLILSGDNTYIGGTTISAGTLRIGAGGTTGSVLGNIVNNGLLEFNRSDAVTFSGVISGSGAVTKLGTGTLTLGGDNTYAGVTSINGGIVQVSKIGAAGATSNTNLGSNGVINMGSGSTTVGLIYDGAGETTDKVINLTGSSGAVSINSSGTGAVVFTSDMTVVSTTSNKTLTFTGTNTGANTFQGIIPNSAGTGILSLSKTGAGTWVLTGANSYTGTTTVNGDGGILRLDGAGKISTGNLTVNAGTLQIMATGQNQSIAALAMGGGAAGSSSTIDIGAGRTLTLGGTVTYSSTNSNLTALITGGAGALLDFGGVVRTFNIGNSTNADPDMRIGANVTLQNGGLIKTGSGTLLIEGTNNLDSLEVQAGAVNGNLGTGNLLLNGGVFESSLTFNRSLGTGNNQVQWAAGANGGFAANGGLFEVAINGGGSLVWDSTPFFVSGAGQLLFGSTTANNVVEFENDIDLNGAVRTVQVVDNTSVTTDRAVLTGVISGGAGSGFTKSGNGVLELRGANLFSGLVTVSGGTLQFSTAANLGNAGANPITLSGGNLNFIGATDVGLAGDVAVTSSSIVSNTGTGELALNGVVTLTNTLTVNGTGEADFAGTVVNSGADRTIVVNNTGGVRFNNLSLTEGTTGRVLIFNVAAGLETNIYGLIANGGSGSSVLRLDGAGTVVVASTATASFTNELRLNNGTLKMQSSKTAQTSTNSIVFSNSAVADSEAILDLDGAGVVYNLGGNILYAANSGITGAASITGTGTLALNATRTFEVRPSANTDTELVISATIANGSAASGVTKSRNGTLVFKGANTYTGTTTISEGILRLDYTGNVDSKIGSTAALTMNGGSLELLGNTTTSVTQSAGTLTVGAGSNRIDVSSNGGPGMILALGGLTSTANGRSMDLVEGDVLASITTTSWAQTNGIFGGWATYNSSQFATADGSGNVQAFASVKNDDVMTWGLNENISDDAGFAGTISGITQINSLLFQSATAESLNVSGELNISSGGILVSAAAGANPTGILGGRLTSSGGALFMHQYNEGASLTISSLLRGALSLTKNGEGELILDSAESSYTGGTFVNKGTLSVTGGNAIGDTSAVTLDAVSGVTFRLLESERIGSLLGGGSDGGLVDLNGQTLTLGNGSSFAGRFTGSGSIVKWGTTNLSLNTSVSSGFTGSVVANQGLVILSSNGVANMGNATLWQVNSGAGLLVDNNGSSTSANRMSDSAAVVFNSANGLSGTAAPYRGLWVRTDQNSTRGETVGAVTYDSGSSYAVFEVSLTGTNTSSIAEFVASTLTRNNFSTLNVRGANLGQGTGAQRGRYRVATAAEAGFMANNMIGGGSLTGTNISIVPWVVGQNLGLNNLSTTVNNQRGNSLATYIAGIGFRPLDFTSDYAIYNDAGVTDNVRMSLAVEEVTGLVGKTVNSLVIDNASNSTAVSLAGSGSLVVTSGAFLFTAVDAANATGAELATPQGIAVGGFADITVGPAVGTVGNEFIMHVMNSAAAGVTITSNLINSTAGNTALTKSGLGTLILTGNNTYSGTTTLNEGVLEIDGWDSIGGASGNATLVFAGGTLRLQAGFTGDFNRTGVIALAQGGGVVDTNGASIAFNTSLTDVAGMSGGITKTGAGTLTLNRAASYTGTTTVLGGVVQAGTNQAIGLGDVVVNGATLDLQTYNASVGRVTLVNSVGSQILGSGTLTSMESVFDLQGGLAEVNLAGTSRLEKTTAGIVELTGANTYTGDTLVSAGVLRAVDGDGLSLASNVEINGGIIASSGTFARALGEDAGELQITGGISGFSAEGGDLTLTLLDNGGSVNWGSPVFNPATLVLNGAGADSLLNWTSGINLNGAARTISVQAGTATLSGLVADGTGSGSLIKTGAGVLAYGAVNSYTGSTSINEGTLKITSDQDLAGALQFGSANNITTAGKLDLSDASATFGSMLVQTNSVGNINEVVIGEGQALTIEGNVTIGTSFGGTTTTNFAASGAGEFIVNNAAANGFFAVGGITTGSGQANRAIADFSDLASMTVNLNTSSGVFRVNPVSTASANVSSRFSTLTLAAETNITANILAIGDGTINNGAVGQVNTLRLGSGMTTINVNTINLGNGTRDSGAVLFDTATGSVKIRGTTGETSRATLNMANTGGGTGAGTDGNVFDVSGHEADLLFGAVTIGTQSRMNAYTNLFAFDQGVLRMTSLAMSGRTAGSTSTGVGLSRDITSTMNLGGGTVTIDNGILSLATLSGSYTGNAAPVITGIINITGGVVNIGATLGVSVNMAGNTASGTPTSGVSTTTAEINITGGTVSMTGNIVKGTVSVANASNASATVTLDGGSLDMNGMAIGTDASRVNFEALSGTLRNLGELNGGGTGTGLLKQGTGLLKVEGVNSFNGGTRIAEGTLELVNSNLRETTVDGTGAVLAGSGTVTSLNLTSGTVSPGALTGDTIGELQVAGNAIFGFSAGAPREIVMEIRGASGMADLSAYDVADIPTMAAELLTRPTGEAYDHDYIEITGTLQWETGATKLVVEDLGVEYAYGMVFNLMDWTAGFTGANLEFPNNPYAGGTANPDFELPDFGTSGLLWDVSLFNDYGVLVVVPEPGRMVLLLAGLTALILRRRRESAATV